MRARGVSLQPWKSTVKLRVGPAVALACGLCLACGERAPSGMSTAGAGGGGSASISGASSGGSGGVQTSGAGSPMAGGAGANNGGLAGTGAGAGNGGSAGQADAGKLSDCELSFPYNDQDPRG